MVALDACLERFLAEMESLGAVACLASYTAEDGDSWSGASDGFGEGPPLMQAGEGLMENILEHDATAAVAIVVPFACDADQVGRRAQNCAKNTIDSRR